MNPDTPLKKVDYNAGDVKRQVANTVKLIMSRYSFQTMGEYNAVLSLYGLTSEETNGRVNGREYHGIVYSVLDENGRKIGNPFKASRLGKFSSLNAVHEKINRSEQNITHEAVAKTRRRVAQSLNESHSKEEFIAALKERNIDLVLRYTDEGRIYGATFIDHDTHTVLNGSRLGRNMPPMLLMNDSPEIMRSAGLLILLNRQIRIMKQIKSRRHQPTRLLLNSLRIAVTTMITHSPVLICFSSVRQLTLMRRISNAA